MAGETLYKGEIRILYIKVDSVYIPVSCLTSNPISESAEMLSTTTRTNNGWESSIPQQQSYVIDFEGLQMLTIGDAGDDTKASYDKLKELKRLPTQVEWKIQDAALNFVDEGFGYISELGEGNVVGEFLSFTGTIIGYGEPIFSSQAGIYLFEDGETFIFEDTTGYLFN